MPIRIVLACVACLLMATAAPDAQARWRRVDTPNFVVMGDVGAGDLRDVGARFESFRDALGRILSEQLVATIVPTVIVVFSSDHLYTPFKPKFGGRRVEVAGTFMPGRDVNYITIGDSRNFETIFHEYTHLLTGNSGLTVPLWLGEGMAEYYSTLEFQKSGREVQVGGLIGEHLALLNDTVLIPLDQFLQLAHDSPLYNEGSRRSVFYAQAWAMTHMLSLDKPNRRAELSNYLAKVTSGMSSLEAWKEAFAGIDVMKDLQRYIRQQLFTAHKYRLDEKTAAFDKLPAIELTRGDADAFLAQLQLRLEEPDAAAARLAAARQREPLNGRLRVTEAMLALERRDYGAAAERLREIDGKDDWLLAYQAAMSLAGLMEDHSESATDANMTMVRAHLGASANARPMLPQAAYRVASLEARRGAVADQTKAALDRARTQAPGRYEYLFLQAQILARGREFAPAKDLLAPLLDPRMPPRIRDFARALLGNVANAEIGRPLGNTLADPPPVRPTGTESFERESVVRPAYRETRPGETRLEGDLQSIECVAGKGITFHVKAQDKVERFTVKSFDEVEFITYRPDLQGSISCDPLVSAMPVYLTWRPGPSPESRVPVAIEFRPVK